METDRLRLLVELERLGSMRAVADELATTTSRVSHQLGLLGREMGAPLLEPDGRLVRLTAAGRRLTARGRTVLAELEAAQAEVAGTSEPAGTVRVASFGTAIRANLLPVMRGLAEQHPRVEVVVTEHEPDDARALLLADHVDLAVVYDYNLAPVPPSPGLEALDLWSTRWGLGVPDVGTPQTGDVPSAVETVHAYRASSWIGNSRNSADERVIAVLTSMAGFTPRVTHRCDDLDAVADLVAAGQGVGLLPVGRALPAGVRLVPLRDPEVVLRASAAYRAGREQWSALRAVLDQLRA